MKYEFLMCILSMTLMFAILFGVKSGDKTSDSIDISTPTVEAVELKTLPPIPTPSPTIEPTPTVTPTVEPTPTPTPKATPQPTPVATSNTKNLSQADIELIALVTMAEAEGESELGKRLVIDTVLNRMDSKRWPNTASGVIYQKGQFSSMWNGRVNRCYVREDICQLVREELKSRTNSEVVFFQMYSYSPYGKALFKEGCHYFSSCK